MNEPTVTLRPSEEIIRAANEVEFLTVAGQKIGIKKPGIVLQYRIVEIVGDSAKNEVYMSMINPILWVAEIDDDAVPAVRTKRELEALIQRLGEEAIVAVAQHIANKITPTESETGLKN